MLRIDGEVAAPLDLDHAQLAAIGPAGQIADVRTIDPKRRGRAVRLAALLELARPHPQAAYLTLHSSRDDFHASIPLAAVRDKALVIYGLDAAPLPESAGGPVRFFIPDYAACHSAEIDECANVKYVDRMELSIVRGHDNRPADDAAHEALHRDESR
jgi:DMSO/TMAO reductase YedYZ molybdopterin-dependent catalytic subunit